MVQAADERRPCRRVFTGFPVRCQHSLRLGESGFGDVRLITGRAHLLRLRDLDERGEESDDLRVWRWGFRGGAALRFEARRHLEPWRGAGRAGKGCRQGALRCRPLGERGSAGLLVVFEVDLIEEHAEVLVAAMLCVGRRVVQGFGDRCPACAGLCQPECGTERLDAFRALGVDQFAQLPTGQDLHVGMSFSRCAELSPFALLGHAVTLEDHGDAGRVSGIVGPIRGAVGDVVGVLHLRCGIGEPDLP